MRHIINGSRGFSPAPGHGPTPPAVRTFRQIAQIIEEREGRSMTPTEVAKLCRSAEAKFAGAIHSDPALEARLEAYCQRQA